MHSHWIDEGLWQLKVKQDISWFPAAAMRSYNTVGSKFGNFIFISIPKTGTTTISNLPISSNHLKVGGRDHQGYDMYKRLKTSAAYPAVTQGTFDNRFVFSFVRNPWDRVVSLFRNRKRLHKCGNNFEKFVEEYQKASDYAFAPRDYRYQLDWLKDPDTGKIMADFIGRFENFESDLEHVMRKISADNKLWYDELPNINGDGPVFDLKDSKSYRKLYTPRLMNIIADKCSKDIEYFNYDF